MPKFLFTTRLIKVPYALGNFILSFPKYLVTVTVALETKYQAKSKSQTKAKEKL